MDYVLVSVRVFSNSVSIQFVKGSIVSFVLSLVYGCGVLGGFLYWKNDGLVIGKRVVIQYYVFSYAVALIITIGWVAKNGLLSRDEGAR